MAMIQSFRYIDILIVIYGWSTDGIALGDRGSTAYIDDITVATQTVEEHRGALEKVLLARTGTLVPRRYSSPTSAPETCACLFNISFYPSAQFLHRT